MAKETRDLHNAGEVVMLCNQMNHSLESQVCSENPDPNRLVLLAVTLISYNSWFMFHVICRGKMG